MPKKKKRSGGFLNTLNNFFSWLGGILAYLFPYILGVVVLGGVLFGLKQYLHAHPQLIVKHVEITMTGDYPTARILRKSEVVKGQSLMGLDIRAIEDRLVGDPNIRSVNVRRLFPSTVGIHLEIREPVAYLSVPSARMYFLIDEEGVVLGIAKPDEAENYPLIVDNTAKIKRLIIGRQFYPQTIKDSFRVIDYIVEKEYLNRKSIRSVNIDKNGSFVLGTISGVEIKIGNNNHEENLDKLPRAFEILKSEDSNFPTFRYIDLRYDDIIVKK